MEWKNEWTKKPTMRGYYWCFGLGSDHHQIVLLIPLPAGDIELYQFGRKSARLVITALTKGLSFYGPLPYPKVLSDDEIEFNRINELVKNT